MNLKQLEIDAERWKAERTHYDEFAKEIEQIVTAEAKGLGIYCETSGRTKSVSEFIKKAIKKENPEYLKDPWKMITDKAGVRAVLNYESDLDRLVASLHENPQINIISSQDKRWENPDQLGYSGIHLQISTTSHPSLECELQIRTAAQHLWSSVVSHRFLYKPLVSAAPEVQHALYRLVSLLELFDGEVGRAMNEIVKLPQYETVQLLDSAEKNFLDFIVNPLFDRELSLHILSSLQRTISDAEKATYDLKLSEWTETRKQELKTVIDEYGLPQTNKDPRYILFSQPEILVFLERLENAKHALEREWRSSQLPDDYLSAISSIWGSPVD